MTVIDPEQLTFEYRLRYRGTPGLEHYPRGYPMRWEVTISGTVFKDDGQGGEEVPVGNAVVEVVPNAGKINLLLARDEPDRELANAAEMLTTERPDLVTENLEDGGDLMIVSSLEIRPEYRGGRIGYIVLNAIIETVGRSVDLVVARAAPADVQGSPAEGSPEYEKATSTLKGYWQDFGFEEASGDYLVFVRKNILE